LNQDNPNVLSYLRRYKNEAVLVVLNMSGTPQHVGFNLSEQGFANAEVTTMLTTVAAAPGASLDLALDPFAVYIARLSR
jgi:glycosidase